MIRFCGNCKYFDTSSKCCKLYGSQNVDLCGFHDYAPGALEAEHEFNLKTEGTEMESYVLILESLISELIGILKGDVKNPEHIKKLCDSAKQFAPEKKRIYFSRVSGTCKRAFAYMNDYNDTLSPKSARLINGHINYLASMYMEIVINM